MFDRMTSHAASGSARKTAPLSVPVLVLALACTTAPAPSLAQTIPLDVGSMPSGDVVPLAQDGVTQALAALPALITDTLKRSGVPGAAVAVVRGGKTVFAEGYGVRELGQDGKVDAETVFQIASLSKPIAGTIGAIQVSNGVVDWNDPVIRHLPTFRMASDYVTTQASIGDFYAHRSGLPATAGDDLEDIGFDRQTILSRLHLLKPDAFRISYHYANFGFTVGAVAVAAASGKPWEDLAEAALFKPLGMSSTSARHADFLNRKNRARLHTFADGRFQPLFDRNPDAQSPAGGVSSNVVDLAEWLKLLLADGRHGGKQMIAPEALLPALRPQAFSAPAQTLDSRSGFYGFGFNVSVEPNGRPAMSHSGAFIEGAGTSMLMIPSADIAIVVLTNGGPVGAAEAISLQFMDIVQFGTPSRDWYEGIHPILMHYYEPVGDLAGKTPPARPEAARPLASYAGTYGNSYFGPARITAEDGRLVFAVGPGAFSLPMTHWNGDTFAIAPRTENAPSGSLSSVRFEMKDGQAVSFTVNYLDSAGMATWTR